MQSRRLSLGIVRKKEMSVSLFNATPAGFFDVLTDATGVSNFKRSDLGRFLGISDMRYNFKNIAIQPRSGISEEDANVTPSLRKSRNSNDIFVDFDGALEIVVRSRKPKVELVKWLTRKGVEKVVQEKQRELMQAVEEKDMQLALLSDDPA